MSSDNLDQQLLDLCAEVLGKSVDCTAEKIQELIDAGANPHFVNRNGTSILHHLSASSFCTKAMLAVLKNSGVTNFNVRDDHGRTPLMYNCAHNLAKNVQDLVELGASVDILDKDGNSALHHFMLANPAKAGVNALRYLLDSGANINALNDFGATPLHCLCASRYCNQDLVHIAKQYGADLSLVDRLDRTPLHILCAYYADLGSMKALTSGPAAYLN